MSTTKKAVRRSARRIGVEQGASFDERRAIILREAARAFNENGVAQTSLDDLAARLGVTKPAIYHYVAGKKELVTQCLQMAVADLTDLLTRVAALDRNGLEQLVFLFEHWAEYATTDFGRAMVLIRDNQLDAESDTALRHARQRLLERIEAVIEGGIADGSIRECNPAIVSRGLVALFNSPADWLQADELHQEPAPLKESIVQLTRLAADGLRKR